MEDYRAAFKKYITEGKISEGKIANSYVFFNEEDENYQVDEEKLEQYLSQFDSDEVSAEVFMEDDEGWGESGIYWEDIETLTDGEIEDNAKQDMSYYFFSGPDEIFETKDLEEHAPWNLGNSRGQKNNSVQQMVDFLKNNPFSSETELQKGTFDYDRSSSWESNKKYADMLRRGLEKGIISRTEAKVKGNKAKYFYFVPASTGGEKDFVYKPTSENLNEGKYGDVVDISADWRDFDGFITQTVEAFKKLGFHVVENPIYEGSDMFGILVSKNPIDADEWYEEEMGMSKTDMENEEF